MFVIFLRINASPHQRPYTNHMVRIWTIYQRYRLPGLAIEVSEGTISTQPPPTLTH